MIHVVVRDAQYIYLTHSRSQDDSYRGGLNVYTCSMSEFLRLGEIGIQFYQMVQEDGFGVEVLDLSID